MKLNITRGASPGQIIPLGNSIFTIGREADNKFVINESGVSRHHCILSPVGGEWYIEDCQSVNGVLVNGVKITSSQLLQAGDCIVVYNHEMFFLADDGEVPASNPVSVPASALPIPAVLVQQESAGMPVGKLLVLTVIVILAGILGYMVFAPEEDMAHVVKVEPAAPADFGVAGGGAAVTESAPATLAPDIAGGNGGDASAQTTAVGSGSDETVTESAGSAASPHVRQGAADHSETSTAISEVVLLLTDPPGATIILDQEVLAQVTPAVLRQVKPGRHPIEFRKEGYESSLRTIHVPDTLPDQPVVLRQAERTVMLVSDPAGAHVWLGQQFLGVTPLLVTTLPEGVHTVRLDGPGCEPKQVEIEVSAARGEKVEVALTRNLGHLEVITQPGGCRVYLGAALIGTTVAAEHTGQASLPLRVNDILAGEQRLKIEHPSGVLKTGKIVIPQGDILRLQVRLAVLTHRLTLTDGSVLEGMVLEINPQGDVAWEGLDRRTERFLKPQIQELRELTPEESRSALENLRKESLRGDDLLSGKGGSILISELERLMLKMPAEEFNKAYSGKRFTLTGRSIMTMPDPRAPGSVVVMFAKNIKCQFVSLSKEELEMMNNGDKPALTLAGVCTGIDRDRVLFFRNCTLTSDF